MSPLPTSPLSSLHSAGDGVTASGDVKKPAAKKMKYTDDVCIALIQAMCRKHIGDPEELKVKGDNNDKRWERIASEPPFGAYLKTGQLSGWRPLYGKGRELLIDYANTLESEKYHTGGGTVKRPLWWARCEKELDTLHVVCLLSCTSPSDIVVATHSCYKARRGQ